MTDVERWFTSDIPDSRMLAPGKARVEVVFASAYDAALASHARELGERDATIAELQLAVAGHHFVTNERDRLHAALTQRDARIAELEAQLAATKSCYDGLLATGNNILAERDALQRQVGEMQDLLRRAAPWTERSSVYGSGVKEEYEQLQRDLRSATTPQGRDGG